MVAWWLRCVTVMNLLVLLAWLAWAWPRSIPLALAGALLCLLGGRLWVGGQFACMVLAKRRRKEPLPPVAVLWRVWNAECLAALRAFGWDMAWAEDAQADYVPDRPVGSAGVVLVHGWLCNRGIWADALHQLRAAGVPCVAVSMPLLLHRIGTGRARLDAAAQRIRAATGLRPVVVAHSMGGLMVRDWLRSLPQADAPQRPQAVLTVATPHQGTAIAFMAWGPNVAQMCPGNPWLRQLQTEEARAGSAASQIRWHCALSEVDNIVFPGTTALLPGATPLWLHGMAHVQMLQAPALWALVRQLVEQGSAEPGTSPGTGPDAASSIM